MTYERRSNYLGKIRHDAKQFAQDVYLVGCQWVRLAWYVGCCVLMTSRLLMRMIFWIVRLLMPVPVAVGPSNRQRRKPTGLSVPTFDLLVIVFGTASLIGYLW
jgi:hypothetical protein